MKVSSLKYACDQCDYQATQKGSLKANIYTKHEGPMAR